MVLNTSQLISTLKNQLTTLEQEVLQHDSHLAPSQRKLLQDIERFNQSLFIQNGAQLMPCIEQIRNSIGQLEKQIALKLAPQTIALSCERIQDRFTAVKRALLTTSIDIKSKINNVPVNVRVLPSNRPNLTKPAGLLGLPAMCYKIATKSMPN